MYILFCSYYFVFVFFTDTHSSRCLRWFSRKRSWRRALRENLASSTTSARPSRSLTTSRCSPHRCVLRCANGPKTPQIFRNKTAPCFLKSKPLHVVVRVWQWPVGTFRNCSCQTWAHNVLSTHQPASAATFPPTHSKAGSRDTVIETLN